MNFWWWAREQLPDRVGLTSTQFTPWWRCKSTAHSLPPPPKTTGAGCSCCSSAKTQPLNYTPTVIPPTPFSCTKGQGKVPESNHHHTELRKASIKHLYCNNKTWNSCVVQGVGVGWRSRQQFLSPNHYTGQQRGERGQGEARKLWDQQGELSIKKQEMLKLWWPASFS